MSSSVKQQVIEDMKMAGLAPLTQRVYLDAIVRFVNRTRIRPQDATEAQVASYLRQQVERGLSQGTIRPLRSALQFIFLNTLGRQWNLFKKESPADLASVCPIL
jgi:site-specific recombinase XerD